MIFKTRSVFLKSHPPHDPTPNDIEKDGWISPGFGWSTIQKVSLLVELAESVYIHPSPCSK